MKNWVAVCAALTLFAVAGLRAEEDPKPGLVGEYYDMGGAVEDFPVLTDKKPTIKRVDKNIAIESVDEKFNGTTLGQHFAVVWTGMIKIEKAGKYKFFLESDDGSRLFINTKSVVENGGQHGMDKKDGEVELPAGTHQLKVDFFQNEGGAGCKLSWSADGGAEEIVPEKVLWHKADAEK